MRTIFHLDLDAFFVSVERVLDPSLNGKSVIVGADPQYGRGVVAACSYEARAYGLHSAMPIKQAYRLCPNGIYLHGHFAEYVRFSKAVKSILTKYVPLIEQASIDEFYLDLTGCEKIYGSLFMFASKLQKEIMQNLSLPCSIGIAGNKTLAKIASDFNKPLGITYVLHGMEKEFLSRMPVSAMPGIGRETTKSLLAKGFRTLGDIADSSEDYFNLAFGKYGSDMWNKANGRGREFLSKPAERKSISHEKTFAADEIDKNKIESVLFNLSGKVCQALRNYNWQSATVSVKLRYSDFITLTRAKTIEPTDDDKIVFETALELFRKAFTRRVAIRLIGIHLANFSEYNEQEKLFTDKDFMRDKMLHVVSKIRDKYGYESIRVGMY